jgi:hypothetical protein
VVRRQSEWTQPRNRTLASLREDYLNQVQRDFLSRPASLEAGQHP